MAHPDPADLLTVAVSAWLTEAAHRLSQENLETLHRALADPDLEASVILKLKSGRIVLQVATATHSLELCSCEVEPLRPFDGFAHPEQESMH
jgi:hypothetical protein